MTKFWMLAPLAAATIASPAFAQAVFDQTAPVYSSGYVSQDFETANDAFDSIVIDDFTVDGLTQLTSVTAALVGFAGFTSFDNVTGYHVNIYSSAAAAGNNLTGDIYSATFSSANTFTPNAFTVTNRNGPNALVQFNINAILLPGTYYVGVNGILDFNAGGGEIGTAVTGNGGDAYIADPGDSFDNGAGGTQGKLIGLGGRSAGYRLDGVAAVPELGTWAMMIAGMGAVGFAMRRRQRVSTGVTFA